MCTDNKDPRGALWAEIIRRSVPGARVYSLELTRPEWIQLRDYLPDRCFIEGAGVMLRTGRVAYAIFGDTYIVVKRQEI